MRVRDLTSKWGILEGWIKIQGRNSFCHTGLGVLFGFFFLIESKSSAKEGKVKGAITQRE